MSPNPSPLLIFPSASSHAIELHIFPAPSSLLRSSSPLLPFFLIQRRPALPLSSSSLLLYPASSSPPSFPLSPAFVLPYPCTAQLLPYFLFPCLTLPNPSPLSLLIFIYTAPHRPTLPCCPSFPPRIAEPSPASLYTTMCHPPPLPQFACITSSNIDDTHGSCKKYGRIDYLTFQCLNFLSIKYGCDQDDSVAALVAMAMFEIKKASVLGKAKSE